VNKNIVRLIWAARRASTMQGYKWSVEMDARDRNPNKPFRCGAMATAGVDQALVEELNDSWGGEYCDLTEAYSQIRVGHVLSIQIRNKYDELNGNCELHILSENEARLDGCCFGDGLIRIDPNASGPAKAKQSRTLVRREEKKTDRLWVRNSSQYPMHEVWPLIKAAYESIERGIGQGQKMPRIIVKLTNCSHAYRGRASWQEWHKDSDAPGYRQQVEWRRILVRIGSANRFPVSVRYPRFKGDMPEYICQTHREGIVMVTAHEMEHCLGASGRKGGEFRCELSASDAIDYYREHQTIIHAQIDSAVAVKAKREVETQQRRAAKQDPRAVAARTLEGARAMLSKWQRKQKLATTKAKQYQRSVRRLEKKLSELSTPAPLALAAKTEQ
jgi:hypothetical protein